MLNAFEEGDDRLEVEIKNTTAAHNAIDQETNQLGVFHKFVFQFYRFNFEGESEVSCHELYFRSRVPLHL